MRHTDMLQSPARQAVYRGTRSGGNALAEATTNVSMGSVRRVPGTDGHEVPARAPTSVAINELLDPVAATAEGTASAENESRGAEAATETMMPGRGIV